MDLRKEYEGSLTHEVIDKLLPELDKADKQYHIDQYHNDWAGVSWAKKRSIRLNCAKEFIDLGQTVEEDYGCLLVNSKFVISPMKRKWKNKGGYKWYRYSNPEQFVKKYIKVLTSTE